jgi:aspartyl-tRNA(Asn)/glutamyl-tRNA(Gln) amidotransferase subunit A
MFTISKRPTISEIHKLYITKKAIPSQVTQFFLNRINEIDSKIQAFDHVCNKLALEQAKVYDQVLELNNFVLLETYEECDEVFDKILKIYPLFGIPFASKAIILSENEVYNASSNILANFKAPYSSTVYKKIRNAGAILLGINNMDEFAMGSSGETGQFGKPKNPFDESRVPGGSSSGASASVGSGQVVFALGTDTGGSIRQPAAFCDTVGLKPTYGLVSRWGVIPMCSSFDQVGSITNNIEDNIIIQSILSGKDTLDQTTIDSTKLVHKLKNLIQKRKTIEREPTKILKTHKPLKIGLPKEFFGEGINPIISKAIDELIEKLKALGHTTQIVSLPLTKYAVSVYYMTMSVEVAANLERIDGIRYSQQKQTYKDTYFEHRGEFFGDEPKRRIMLGTYASSSGYYDAYYNQAQKVRELSRKDFDKVFESCDLLLTPTTPEFPFKFGDKSDDPISMYMSDITTCGINPARVPALSVPLGLFEFENSMLPTGVQLISKELNEDLLYELGLEIEHLTKNNRPGHY